MKNHEKNLPDEPFNPDDERPVEADELYFSEDDEPSFEALTQEPEEEKFNQDSQADENFDEAEPEILIKEDGARSPHERSADTPVDEALTIVGINDIGAGYGLDEEELAHIKPLDGKPEL